MKMDRREFLIGAGAAAVCGRGGAAATPTEIRGVLLHLGCNMWGDYLAPGETANPTMWRYTEDHVRFSEDIWAKTVDHAKRCGLNLVIMDLGEFMKFPSHPELAVEGSWEPERMNAEVRRLREMGLEPIPKLNFSAAHDSWLKDYHRMLSTRQYYKVCADLIRDVRDVFETPRFLHIGYDEERYDNQKRCDFAVVRQGELWWHDFLWFVKGIERLGRRAWMFRDYGWHHPEFVKRCPRSVLQMNWYYDEDVQGFDLSKVEDRYVSKLRLFNDLDKAGFEQTPMGSNWMSPKQKAAGRVNNDDCMEKLVKYCRDNISPELLKGFVVASWTDTAGAGAMKTNLEGITQLAEAVK